MNVCRFRPHCILGFLLAVPLAAVLAAPPRIAGVKAVPRSILKFERDYVAPLGDDAPIRAGATVDVLLLSGKRYEQLEIADIQTAKDPGTFRGLTFKPSKGQPTRLAGNTLYQLRTADGGFDVVADPAAKAFVLLDLAKRDEVAERRLSALDKQLWKEPTADEEAQALKFYEDLYDKAKTSFPTQNFSRTETRFFIVYTDMPAGQVAGYIANLDSMYQQLCTLFGVLKDANIWLGKCPVFIFVQREHFADFEARFLNNPDTQKVAGLNHQFTDGKVVITCHRGNDPVFFGALLVHETSHGFLHRVRSSGRIPPWMNEGIAEWIAQVVVPTSDLVKNRFAEALPIMRANGSLGGDFLDDSGRIDGWQYGVAATLTQFMLTSDPNAYRAMITAIKEGYRWQEALEVTYGISPEELAAAYGRSIGLPGLRP